MATPQYYRTDRIKSQSIATPNTNINASSAAHGNVGVKEKDVGEEITQIQAIDRLTSLALKQEGREIIGGTDGVLRNLFSLFFMEKINNNVEKEELVRKAGEALALLSFHNNHNCQLIILMSNRRDHPDNLIAKMFSVLHYPVQGIHAARILRSLFVHADEVDKLIEIPSIRQVMEFVIEKRDAHQEAAIGLAAQILGSSAAMAAQILGSSASVTGQFQLSAQEKKSLISELVEVFRRHPHPSKEVPSIRRFSIELLIAVMKVDRATALEMKSELEAALDAVMRTTSEMESYSTISGGVRLSSCCLPIKCLALSAMELLGN